ncbi:MAG: putative toxin-antitoxin system toxin component, PIN family [Agathobacter sp.]|nr:putative toxin-antitoxin system toxin component, PIN family [Agathobacter sp.]
MRILIDTNILFSAVLKFEGTPRKAFNKAVSLPNTGIVSYQSLEELVNSFYAKLPIKVHLLEHFLVTSLSTFELISIPQDKIDDESKIRDIDDRTILRAAVKAQADIILTGDKDLLESGITSPQIMTAREFLELNDCE